MRPSHSLLQVPLDRRCNACQTWRFEPLSLVSFPPFPFYLDSETLWTHHWKRRSSNSSRKPEKMLQFLWAVRWGDLSAQNLAAINGAIMFQSTLDDTTDRIKGRQAVDAPRQTMPVATWWPLDRQICPLMCDGKIAARRKGVKIACVC